MIHKIYMILGKSCSGKNTVFSRLIKDFPFLVPVVEYTTRLKRDYEVDGVDHYFVSEEEFDSFDDIIDKREYTMKVNRENKEVYYGNRLSWFEDYEKQEETFDLLCITTLEGLKMFCENEMLKGKIVAIYLVASNFTRLRRYKARINIPDDTPNEDLPYEVLRRITQDDIDFAEKKLKDIPIDLHRIDANASVGIVTTEVKHIIINTTESNKDLARMAMRLIESKKEMIGEALNSKGDESC